MTPGCAAAEPALALVDASVALLGAGASRGLKPGAPRGGMLELDRDVSLAAWVSSRELSVDEAPRLDTFVSFQVSSYGLSDLPGSSGVELAVASLPSANPANTAPLTKAVGLERAKARTEFNMSSKVAPLRDRDMLSRPFAACRTICAEMVWSLRFRSSLAARIARANSWRLSDTNSFCPDA
jgi:hypothetical protein